MTLTATEPCLTYQARQRKLPAVLVRFACLLVLTVIHLPSARADANRPNLVSAPAPFTINHLAYDTHGRLGEAPDSSRAAAQSLFYGEPITNATFRSDLLTPALESSPARTQNPSNNAPARPLRPRFTIDRWDREHGLPANKVNALLQTRDGFLWIGTVGGVARFDGVRFTPFTEANTPEMRVNGGIGRALFEDEKGRLWIGTERGMLCYQNGRFVDFPGQEEVRGRDVRCFARRAAGGFWVGADAWLGYWDGAALHWEMEVHSDNKSWNRILALAESADDECVWVGAYGGFWRADLKSKSIEPVSLGGHQPIAVLKLLLDRRQRLWIGSAYGIWLAQPGSPSPRPISGGESDYRIPPYNSAFFEETDGTILATTSRGNGLYRLTEDRDSLSMTKVADQVENTSCILMDREGALWVGSNDQGIYRLRPQHLTTLTFGGNNALDHIRSLTEGADGSLWFASRAFIGRWSGREISLIDIRGLGDRTLSPILSLSSDGSIATAFPPKGLFVLPGDTGQISANVPALPLHPEMGEITVLHPRSKGGLWIGTHSGLYCFNNSKPPEKVDALSGAKVQALLEDRHHNLWIGTTSEGLIRLDTTGITRYTEKNNLPSRDVQSLHESEDGTIWIGTGSGLCLSRQDGIEAFGRGSGLTQGMIYSILEDDWGRLWFSHSTGIARVDRNALYGWLRDHSHLPAVAEFGAADGMLTVEGAGEAQPVGARTRDGRLWFPTRRGIVVVDPAAYPTTPVPPKAFIENVEVDGENWPVDGSLTLKAGQGRLLEFQFTATSLHSPGKVQLRYRLEPHDIAWRDASIARTAAYTDLKSGDYRLRVQARNHEGVWSEQDTVLPVRLAPFFWQTWPFQFACGFVIAGMSGGLITWRRQQQKRRLQVERSQFIESERARIARDIHDHLGAQLSSLALASGENGAMQQKVRESLSELNELIWSIHPCNDTLASLVDFVATFASQYLSSARLELDLDLPEQVPDLFISSHLRREIAALFKEALRNVAQHAHATRVQVRMKCQGNELTLTVLDNGLGFVPSANEKAGSVKGAGSYAGNGLGNFQTRAKNVGGYCQIESKRHQGTSVKFVIPLAADPQRNGAGLE